MKINREELLRDLHMVKSGLSAREFVEQSSCFVFHKGYVKTYNEEIACQKKTELNIKGAVQAQTLLDILDKLPDKVLQYRDNGDRELEFLGAKKNFGLVKEAKVLLPIDKVDVPEDDDWVKVPHGLMESVRLARHCVSTDESRFILTCVNIAPDHLQACDNLQAIRFHLKTGFKRPMLVRGKSLEDIVQLEISELAQTKSWLHFRNDDGLIYSCRQYSEKYPAIEELFEVKGHGANLPNGVAEAAARANVFASDKAGDPLVHVRVTTGKMRITGRGLSGWYKEDKEVDYEGPELQFLIAPEVLTYVCENYASAQLSKKKLRASGTKKFKEKTKDGKEVKSSVGFNWEYVTALSVPSIDAAASKAVNPIETEEEDTEEEDAA